VLAPTQPSAFGVRWSARKERLRSTGTRAIVAQTPRGYSSYPVHVSVTAIVAVIESAARSVVATRSRLNAAASPTTRNGSAGIR
jgi:hypothetical protein